VTPVAELEDVGLVREGKVILDAVNWTIQPGERWVVLGANGSGKTSLLEILSTYVYPSHGRVTVLGRAHGHTDVRELRRHIGYASAALVRLLRPELTARDAVVTAATAVLDPWWAEPSDADVARSHRMLELVGCGGLADRRIGTLSEGERQRVQIARALMAEPSLLLLDEPTAGLDLGGREQLVGRLGAIAAGTATAAIVFVTHHVEEVPRGFGHALLLRAGRVMAAGPMRFTLTAATLSACFDTNLHLERRRGRFAAWGIGDDA
jgi:iron complex transport system ATP-binding protein